MDKVIEMHEHEYEMILGGRIYFFTDDSPIEMYESEDDMDPTIKLDPQDIEVLLLVYNHLQKNWREDDD